MHIDIYIEQKVFNVFFVGDSWYQYMVYNAGHTYINTYMHANIYTYIHAYIIHTVTYIHIPVLFVQFKLLTERFN